MQGTRDLTGQVVVVTGASRGIGAEVSRALAAAGARVVCAARTMEEGDNAALGGSLSQTVAEIAAAGGEAVAVAANLASDEGCEAVVDAAFAAYGRVDVLVNNAAVGFFGPLLELSPSRWALSWRVTVDAPVRLSQLVLPSMIERGDGRIVNISSEAAVGPGAGPYAPEDVGIGDTAYGAQKAAIERLSQGLAREVYPAGVGVAVLAPSLIVPTPGALFNNLIDGAEDPRAERPSYMCDAVHWLATAPLAEMTGRVVYSQQLLLQIGAIEQGGGLGVDATRPVSGFATG